METRLADFIRDTPEGARAREILGNCVHCGFCTATCPTYQLIGDELDGPRGRIYQIKQVLEGAPPTHITQRHLDRCLHCLNCETGCPSGVRYGELLHIGKAIVERQVPRPLATRLWRRLLLATLPYPARIGPLIRLGQLLRPLLPGAIRARVYPRRAAGRVPPPRHSRKVLMPGGCVQPAMAPNINAAATRVLDRLGISVLSLPIDRCCGAINLHTHDEPTARRLMRANIDAWWPHIEAGAEVLVSTASGCGATIKEYAAVFRNDRQYAAKAARVATMCRDLAELLQGEDLAVLDCRAAGRTIAFHPPCTLLNAQRLPGSVERILERLGFVVSAVADQHLCCGSAGSYSLFQPRIASSLREQKLRALAAPQPDLIATANIGCMYHLQAGTETPVRHWIELLDQYAAGEITADN